MGVVGAVGSRQGSVALGNLWVLWLGCPAVLAPAPRDTVDYLLAWVQLPPERSMI